MNFIDDDLATHRAPEPADLAEPVVLATRCPVCNAEAPTAPAFLALPNDEGILVQRYTCGTLAWGDGFVERGRDCGRWQGQWWRRG